MKAAAFRSSTANHVYDKMVVIGDIHGQWHGLMELLGHSGLIVSQECVWRESSESVLLVQTGDVVDRGRHATECFECLRHLQATAKPFGHRVIRLIGNHELMWLGAQYDYRNVDSDTPLKINKLTKGMVDDILQGKLLGSFYTEEFGGVPIVVTHAGLREELKTQILSRVRSEPDSVSEGERVSAYISDRLARDVADCYLSRGYTDSFRGKIRCGVYLTDVIYSVGKERGGSSIGGVMWTDYSVLEEEAGHAPWSFVQVVGHTMKKGVVRSTVHLQSVCVDAGMLLGGRAYLVVSAAGRFYSREKQADGRWVEADVTSQRCQRLV